MIASTLCENAISEEISRWATIVIAVAALWTALKSNQLATKTIIENRRSRLEDKLVGELFELPGAANGVRERFVRMLQVFPSYQQKQNARSEWTADREAVLERILILEAFSTKLDGVKVAWEALENVEPSCVLNNSIGGATQAELVSAMRKYDCAHISFIDAVREALRHFT